jgi:uncharacterized protein YdhG (YjbR/CyaY superfamily)
MTTAKPKNIDDYIAGFPDRAQKGLEQIRAAVKKAEPKAEEAISYGIPAFNLNSRYLVYFAGYKKHISIYPVPTGNKIFEKDFAPYYTSGKGTIQFPLDKPIPISLVTKIVKFRMKENSEKEKSKKTISKKPTGKNHIKYHNDGTVWAKGKMVNDTPEGYWEWFRKDGVIMRSGYFNKGKQAGEWTTYDKKGKVYKVTKMK